VQRPARLAVPGDRRLALVGDADAGEVLPAHTGVGERGVRDATRDVPDLLSVVLDSAGAREVLPELGVRAPARASLGIEHEARRAGRALVDPDDHGRAAYAAVASNG
jgi:hypothetical protein